MHKFPRLQKPTKEFNESVQEKRIIRGELQKLRKENSRLRKLLEKEFNRNPEPEPEPMAEDVKIKQLYCPECHKTRIKSLVLPTGKTIHGCEDCDKRWTTAPKKELVA